MWNLYDYFVRQYIDFSYYISDNYFYGDTSIESVTIPKGILAIGKSAFEGCTKLKSITVPESVTKIDERAFYNCPNLTFYGESGSYAEKYAKDNNIKFVITQPK